MRIEFFKAGILFMVLIALSIPVSAANLAFNKWYFDPVSANAEEYDCVDLTPADDCPVDEPCEIAEETSYWICTTHNPSYDCDSATPPLPHELCFSQPSYQYTPPPNVTLESIEIDGIYIKAKIRVPHHSAKNKTVKLQYYRENYGTGVPQPPAVGYFKVLDTVPESHMCTAINLEACGGFVQANNNIEAFDVLSEMELYVYNLLYAVEQVSVGGPPYDPDIGLSSTEAKINALTKLWGDLNVSQINNPSGGSVKINSTLRTMMDFVSQGESNITNAMVVGNSLFPPIYVSASLNITGRSGLTSGKTYSDSLTVLDTAFFGNSFDTQVLLVLDNLFVTLGNFDAEIDKDIQLVNGRFMGPVNLRKACNTKSNRVWTDNDKSVVISFASGTGCGDGEPCESNSDCTSLTCTHGYCVGGGRRLQG